MMCRSERGDEVRLMNPHIQELGEDVLYHLALGSGSHDLEKMFGDIKFVCMGGTPQRMKMFAGNADLDTILRLSVILFSSVLFIIRRSSDLVVVEKI